MFESDSHLTKPCLVFGCGNPLFGDDGFGAQVIEHLTAHYEMPRHVACLDIGTAIRDLLFDILLYPKKPEQIIIVDAMNLAGGVPGQIYEIDVDQIQPEKISDFSLHQFPTTNMLKEIKEGTDIEVRVLVAQTADVPDEVRPGLSPALAVAVPVMCRRIMEIVAHCPQPSNQSGEFV